MGVTNLQKNRTRAITDSCLCSFCNQLCPYQANTTDADAPPESKRRTSTYNEMVRCLKCPVMLSIISANSRLQRFFSSLGNQISILVQKMELDQMLLNKQRFCLETIQREHKDHWTKIGLQERVLRNRITKYEYLLAKRAIYLHTLQALSAIIGQIPDPDILWRRTSALLTSRLPDLEAVGLLLLEEDCCRVRRQFTDMLPLRISALVNGFFDQEDFCSRFAEKDAFVSLYQIYWETRRGRKRLGPRTEEMMERCLLFPVKVHRFLAGIFVVLMKNLSSSVEECAPFFSTAARLIEEGIIAVMDASPHARHGEGRHGL
ncbi:MAG: hypothetical protein ACMUIS_00400 [bacterium]